MALLPAPLLPTLIVAGDSPVRREAERAMRQLQLGPVSCLDSAQQLMSVLGIQPAAAVVLDDGLPHAGLPLIANLSIRHPQVRVILVTARRELPYAVAAMQHGACDVLCHPLADHRVGQALSLALTGARPLHLPTLPALPEVPELGPDGFITADAGLRDRIQHLRRIAPLGEPVLLSGESGTGKDLLARALHAASGRRGHFVHLPCAGLDEQIAARMLFGDAGLIARQPGAAVDAGLMLRAHAGTLVLDDCEALPPAVQTSLVALRPGGSDLAYDPARPWHPAPRLIATSRRSLPELQQSSNLRPDLLSMLAVHHLHLPPLRERPQDVALLLQHQLELTARLLKVRAPQLPPRLSEQLASYPFPGNVRELRHLVVDAYAVSHGDQLSERPFQAAMLHARHAPTGVSISSDAGLPTLRQARHHLVSEALARAGGNRARAARQLGISRQALSQLLIKRQRILASPG